MAAVKSGASVLVQEDNDTWLSTENKKKIVRKRKLGAARTISVGRRLTHFVEFSFNGEEMSAKKQTNITSFFTPSPVGIASTLDNSELPDLFSPEDNGGHRRSNPKTEFKQESKDKINEKNSRQSKRRRGESSGRRGKENDSVIESCTRAYGACGGCLRSKCCPEQPLTAVENVCHVEEPLFHNNPKGCPGLNCGDVRELRIESSDVGYRSSCDRHVTAEKRANKPHRKQRRENTNDHGLGRHATGSAVDSDVPVYNCDILDSRDVSNANDDVSTSFPFRPSLPDSEGKENLHIQSKKGWSNHSVCNIEEYSHFSLSLTGGDSNVNEAFKINSSDRTLIAEKEGETEFTLSLTDYHICDTSSNTVVDCKQDVAKRHPGLGPVSTDLSRRLEEEDESPFTLSLPDDSNDSYEFQGFSMEKIKTENPRDRNFENWTEVESQFSLSLPNSDDL